MVEYQKPAGGGGGGGGVNIWTDHIRELRVKNLRLKETLAVIFGNSAIVEIQKIATLLVLTALGVLWREEKKARDSSISQRATRA